MSVQNTIAVSYTTPFLKQPAQLLAVKLGLTLVMPDNENYKLLLIVTPEHLQLQPIGSNQAGPVYVDFLTGKMAHRRQYGGGKGQLIARAIGLKQAKKPLTVLDTTAGLGQDAFVLACLGCQVHMLERSPIIASLLQDGLDRANKEAWFNQLNLTLLPTDAISYLQTPRLFDVIYLDPMYEPRIKSSLVKKEMRIVRAVVGSDFDIERILQQSMKQPAQRVVLKRARHSTTYMPDYVVGVIRGKTIRYDIYNFQSS